jgi:hypothetical protein
VEITPPAPGVRRILIKRGDLPGIGYVLASGVRVGDYLVAFDHAVVGVRRGYKEVFLEFQKAAPGQYAPGQSYHETALVAIRIPEDESKTERVKSAALLVPQERQANPVHDWKGDRERIAKSKRKGNPAHESPSIILWHGAHRWSGPPEIREARLGHVEHGPGIYLTTGVETARHYARGGGSLVRFELDPNIRWLDGVRVSTASMKAFVKSLPRLRSREKILSDIDRVAARETRESGTIRLNVLVNLLVNYTALSGKIVPLTARWLVENGADADLVRGSRGDDWVVLFNPALVRSTRRIPASEAQDTRLIRSQNPVVPPGQYGGKLPVGTVVRAFRNLTIQPPERGYSLQTAKSPNKQIAVVPEVIQKDVELTVYQAGVEWVRANGRKRPHAYFVGEVIPRAPAGLVWTLIHYNPYKVNTFVEAKTGAPVHRALYTKLTHDGAYAVLPTSRRTNPAGLRARFAGSNVDGWNG